MRTCIKTGSVACTDCCKVIGIAGNPNLLQEIRTGKRSVVDGDKLVNLWKKVSKRRAKKINQYAVIKYKSKSGWFICKNLTETGCKDQDNKPNTCQTFIADNTYSPSCEVDSRVFFRSKEAGEDAK